MKSVFICALILAMAQDAFGDVCNTIANYSSTLITPCLGNDVVVLWPYYPDASKFWKCIDVGNPVLFDCPEDMFFTYFFQKCTYCTDFMQAPSCETLAKTTDVTCIPNANPTPTATPEPTTTLKPTETPKPTATPNETSTPTSNTTSKPSTTPNTTKNPQPPTEAPTSGVPTPPLVITPQPGVPTPPSQGVTPPVIGTPPSLTPQPTM